MSQGTYRGPTVILTRDELKPLHELLILMPRGWNKELRERIEYALDFNKLPERPMPEQV